MGVTRIRLIALEQIALVKRMNWTVDIVTKDIGLKFGIDKCGVLAMKRGKEVKYNGIEFQNGEEID